ncbi:unnamed protein product [Porites lobata]|uniref:Uncharacterized protein n=1 Tax=Porites lobata TaxID=104759 RepID=A0ABN8QVT3_9CNID|nr:unnamed protein product [Porites lobata]
MDTEDLARLRTQSARFARVMFPRTWRQRSLLTWWQRSLLMKSTDTEDLA